MVTEFPATVTVETLPHAYLVALRDWALSYRSHGTHGSDRDGSYTRLAALHHATYGELLLETRALQICRALWATGKGAFEV